MTRIFFALLALAAALPAQAPTDLNWSTELPVLREAVDADPGNLGLRLRLARALLRPDSESAHPEVARARLKEAREQLDAILEQDPDARDPLRAQVIYSYTTDRHEEVVEKCRKLLSLVGVDADLSIYLIRSLVQLGRKEEAAREFAAWVGTGAIRSFGEVQGLLMGLLFDKSLREALEKEMKAALEADPGNTSLLLFMAVHKAQIGRNVDAWELFHQAERLGVCGLRTGHRHPFARELLERSLEPDEGPWSYESTRLPELKAALEKAPEHAGLAMRVARVLDTSAGKEEALPYYARACAANPGLWAAWYRRAQLLERKGQHEEALASYRQVLERAPRFEAARLQLARTLAKAGKVDEAVSALSSFAARFAPEQHSRMVYRALAGAPKGLESAAIALEALSRAEPKNPYPLAHLALVLRDAGRTEEARKAAILMERRGLAGGKGEPHPLIQEVFGKKEPPRLPADTEEVEDDG